MHGCCQLTLDFIWSLGHWGLDPEAQPLLPPDERYYPPPDTILTAPQHRPKPLSGILRSSSSSLNPLTGVPLSPTNAKQSLERIRRVDSITQTHTGGMRPIRSSQPPTPTTANSRHFATGSSQPRPPTSSSTTLPRLTMPMPSFFPILNTGAQTVPLPTPVPLPDPQPVAAFQMARSVSEGQSLDFGVHQLGRSGSGGIVVQRGRGTLRPRANTSANIIDRSGLTLTPADPGAVRRGRSPGPRFPGLVPARPLNDGLGIIGGGSGSAIASRSLSGESFAEPDVPTDVDHESNEGETVRVEEDGVVRRDLRLRNGWPTRRGRGRGRPGRGRAVTH